MRFTLNTVLTAGLIGLAVLLGVVYREIDQTSRGLTDGTADEQRSFAIQRAGQEFEMGLGLGERVVRQLKAQLEVGECEIAQQCLLATLVANETLAEVTLTQGTIEGDENDATGQVTAFREAKPGTRLCIRQVRRRAGAYFATTRCRPMAEGETATETEVADPLKDPTFILPAYRVHDFMYSSDLSFSKLDEALPEPQRRVVLVRMMGFEDKSRNLVRVVKVGIESAQIDLQVRKTFRVTPKPDDPHRIFLADPKGRLISRLPLPSGEFDPRDRMVDDNDDLRVVPFALPPEVKEALAHPSITQVRLDDPATEANELVKAAEGSFDLAGRAYHVSYRIIEGSQDWRVGVVGPDDFFFGPLKELRFRMIVQLGGVFVALFLGGVLSVRVLRRALTQIERETTGMSALDFTPTPPRSPFSDVRETLHSLEQAKTAVRAMGRYVPMALVRRLFQENKEPALGGVMREVTIFFSDIEGFTTRAEVEKPDVVAQWLGRYLEVMTGAVHAEDGTVDKFIGDSVMALWNAPHEAADHAVKACRAALRCQAETAKLYASAEWGGRPPMVTRIGLHVGEVMVGHFGAPDRLSYTAIGDSVNLASRLEGLNRQYGTQLLVSEDVFRRAKHAFAFRRLDHVAVKGKSQAIGVYELLGPADVPGLVTPVHQRYEQALELYVEGRFARARELLLQNPADPPSLVLARRCADLEREPPTQPWSGISFAQSK